MMHQPAPLHETAIVVAHEIYGVNSHIDGVAAMLRTHSCDVFTPSLLPDGIVYSRAEEALAYRRFTQNPGLERMAQALSRGIEALRPRYRRVLAIGFSVGATSTWLASATAPLDAAVCFYGSRIRDHLEVRPAAPCLLLFAEQEPAFSASEVAQQLRHRQGVTVETYPCSHGFSDPAGPAYSPEHARRAWEQTTRFLRLPGSAHAGPSERR
jgi:dienelactone hydrolase